MLKIQFLNGGLANQAFQYIFARYYELSHPGEIMYMDDSYFALNTVHNGYELEKVFGIKPHMLSEAFDADVWAYMLEQKKQGKSIPWLLRDNGVDMKMVAEFNNYTQFNPFLGKVYQIPSGEYDPNILDFDENIYYHGYWLNKGWFEMFKQQFRMEFCFPAITDEYNKALMHRILNEKSTAMHIRRGDYVDIGVAYDAEKYREMTQMYLDHFGGDTTLFVFSDDIAWAKENSEAMLLNQFRECVFVEGNMNGRNYRDLQLMSSCKYMIIGHSAFGFLAALLNIELISCVNASNREV
ncbi:MAG: alpha-1,2-fucosyltransferase [Lachnospiraceae bacterium]|nr:alpha-1,2-fucosyltransferase [Lachnospiraceae bacterium]